jgi:uncharacterized membrane protein
LAILIAGILLWSVLHLFPVALPAARDRVAKRVGANPYRGLFSLLILLSLVLMVIGWRRTDPELVYVPPLFGSLIVAILVFVSFFLFAASHAPGNIKRFLRHPMLTGTILWAVAHLLANGDNRSIVLFGGLGVWALVSIVLINRRDGAYTPPPAMPLSRDLRTLAGAAVVFVVVALVHRWLFGVSPFPAL